MRRPTAPLLATGVVVAIATITAMIVFAAQMGSHATPQAASATDSSQSQEVARVLSHLATDPAALVAATSQRRVGAEARRGVPVGSTVTPDPESWRPDHQGGGVMTVTVTPPGQPSTSYVVIMVHEPDGWKVLETIPLLTVTPAEGRS
jgi:hypothetical protein